MAPDLFPAGETGFGLDEEASLRDARKVTAWIVATLLIAVVAAAVCFFWLDRRVPQSSARPASWTPVPRSMERRLAKLEIPEGGRP